MHPINKLSRSHLEDLDRRFQEELAGLEREKQARVAEEANPRLRAQREFEALRQEYRLTVADVLTFFPQEEAVAYLTELMSAPSPAEPAPPPARKKSKTQS
ncbi:MAG: 2-hydroxyacyl-CoA dehydratase [Rhodanobacter sp.]